MAKPPPVPALKPCDACGETVSTKAAACPKCGHPVPPPPQPGGCLEIASGCLGILTASCFLLAAAAVCLAANLIGRAP